MDVQTKAIIENVQDLPESEKGKVLSLIMFLRWQRHGGPKTAEIKRGERIHAELQKQAA